MRCHPGSVLKRIFAAAQTVATRITIAYIKAESPVDVDRSVITPIFYLLQLLHPIRWKMDLRPLLPYEGITLTSVAPQTIENDWKVVSVLTFEFICWLLFIQIRLYVVLGIHSYSITQCRSTAVSIHVGAAWDRHRLTTYISAGGTTLSMSLQAPAEWSLMTWLHH